MRGSWGLNSRLKARRNKRGATVELHLGKELRRNAEVGRAE